MTQTEWFLFAILPLSLAVIVIIVGEWSRSVLIRIPLESDKAKVTMKDERTTPSSNTSATTRRTQQTGLRIVFETIAAYLSAIVGAGLTLAHTIIKFFE
ncbi:MAG: hypothetical protein ABSD08_12315 [Xanthobacteraceae bacterium]|jgi:hypothetical protein